MALQDWLNKLKKNAEETVNPLPLDPIEEQRRRKEQARKDFERAAKAAEALVRGVEAVDKAKATFDDLLKDAAQGTIRFVDKAQPTAAKVDDALDATSARLRAAGGKLKQKMQRAQGDKTGRPTTQSGLVDFVLPVIPETADTLAKNKRPPASPPF